MAPRDRVKKRGLEGLYLALGQRRGRRLHEQVCRDLSLRPRLTLSRAGAVLIASSIHGLTIVLVALGIWLFVTRWRFAFFDLLGLFCILVAWQLRPRVLKVPEGVLSRDQSPAMYVLADRIAEAIGARHVDGILVAGWYQAWFGRLGWNRRRILMIGAPLLAALLPQERVALIAHELGHDVNGDPTRGLIVGSAIDTLGAWYWMLHPRQIGGGWIASVTGTVLLFLANVANGIAYVLIHLLWQDQQRSEYLADHLAARVAGREGQVSMLRKLYLSSVYRTVVHSSALNRTTDVDLLEDFQRRIATTPLDELIKQEEKETEAGFRLDATHPPTAYRIEFALARPATPAEVLLTSEESAEVDTELRSAWMPLQAEVLDAYRASLYG